MYLNKKEYELILNCNKLNLQKINYKKKGGGGGGAKLYLTKIVFYLEKSNF